MIFTAPKKAKTFLKTR